MSSYINSTGEQFTIGSDGFLTIKEYCEKYRVSAALVCNWIKRGVIPDIDTLLVPEFNNSTLVRDKVYSPRKYKMK